jgi:hypothetical protein
MLVIPALGGLRQEDHEFEASLDTQGVPGQQDPVSKNKK